ncbi:hypothetical protein EP47_00540 [Legionella norrlandica]|uniref:Uncharacterized protein n=1 Tax=Legionella norrlandica TaxID=1498499 RepID=A0A0A2SY72_9GAMM|nr:hypothetical protein [Legionella norrlandica]KGP64364.1 hypothetical protein EP47_00540 [Legionella norrlandica]
MIEVNIWLSTATLFKRPIKHQFFGPLLASGSEGENIGHVNFTIEIDERSKTSFDFIEDHALELNAKKTLLVVATKEPKISSLNSEPPHLKPIIVKSDIVPHSFWPEKKPTKKEVIKGTQPSFNTHENDMINEDSLRPMVIEHRTSALEEVVREKNQNTDLYSEISDLDISLEKRALFKKELEKLYTEKEDINEQQKLHKVEQAISYHEEELKKIEARINGRDEKDLEKLKSEALLRKEYTARREQYVKNRDFTEGRHPEHSIILPTQESGLVYYVDELKILNAMLEERKQDYSFLFNNCASSAKRCILKGIDDGLRTKLKEAGLSNKFFKVNRIETCKSLRDWTKTLENQLNKLNSSIAMHP